MREVRWDVEDEDGLARGSEGGSTFAGSLVSEVMLSAAAASAGASLTCVTESQYDNSQ